VVAAWASVSGPSAVSVLAPRSWGRRASRATDKWYREPFFDQDGADVASIRSKRSAIASPITRWCSLRTLGAGTVNVVEVEVAELDEIAETPGCSSSKVGFGLAGGVAGLGGVEADQADVGLFGMNVDSVAVDNPDIGWIDWFCIGWYGKEQRNDAG
jgi:hypothetical protein